MNLIAVYIILPNAYKQSLKDMLKSENLDCTFIAATGLFLKEGQTTCLIVTDTNMENKIVDMVKKVKKSYDNKNNTDDLPGVFVFTTPVNAYLIIN